MGYKKQKAKKQKKERPTPKTKKDKHFFLEKIEAFAQSLTCTLFSLQSNMSIVPYVPVTMEEPISIGPIALTAVVLVLTWLVTELETLETRQRKNIYEIPLIADAIEEEELPKAQELPKEKSPLEHPLDMQITRILSASDKPLTAREILKQIALSEKSEINSRLYTLLRQRKLTMNTTKGAPQWSM